MNEWLTLWSAWTSAWQLQLEPWMPWVHALVQWVDSVFHQMPALVWAGAALWLTIGVADRAQRWRIARSSAYWLCGAALAVSVGMMASTETLLQWAMQSEWVVDIALGWVLFTVGQLMDMRWLLRNKALGATAVLAFGLTALALSAALILLGLPWPAACVAGVLLAHSSPVMLASFMPDWQADGQISARAMHLGGINTLLVALCLPLCLVLGQAWLQSAVQSMQVSAGMEGVASGQMLPLLPRSGWELAQPMLLLMLSLGVGAALGRMLSRTHFAAQGRSDQSLAMRWQAAQSSMGLVAAACVCAGLAQWWGAPAWAACLALGLTLRSATGAPWRIGQSVQQSLTRLAQVVLFALSALILLALISQSSAQLSQWDLSLLLPLVALIVCLRLFCQLLVCTLTAHWAGLRWQQGFALGLAMQPFSMTGLALLLMAWPLLMQGGALLASALVLAVLLSDVFAPLGLKVLLKQCGEMQPDDIAGMRSRNSTQAERIDTSPHANAAPWPWMPV